MTYHPSGLITPTGVASGGRDTGARSELLEQCTTLPPASFKATLSRLGDGQGMAGVAGVQLEVPDHLQVQLDTGSMLCSLALVQARGHRALARRGQQHGRVVTGGAPFFGCSREVCLGVGLARTLVQSQGPRALFLEQSLLLEGKKVKGERPKTDEPGKPRVPPTPPHCSRKRVPRSLLAPHFLSGKQLNAPSHSG